MTIINVTDATLKGDVAGPTFTGKVDGSKFSGSVTYVDTTTPPVNPPAEHAYEDLTKYYKFPTGTTTFPSNTSVHCQVTNGDHSQWDASCDFAGLSREGVGKFPAGANIHLDYHFLIEAGDSMTGRWVICGEVHNEDGELGRATSPPLSIHFDKDKMSIVAIAGGTSSSNDKWMWPWTDTNKIERGRDYHITVDVKFTNDGYLKVTRDGVTLVDYHGNIGYGASTYWMPDIYRSNTNPTTRETTAVKFWDMQVWTD